MLTFSTLNDSGDSTGFTAWPVRDAARYRELGYWRGETFSAALERICAESPSRIAVRQDAECLSYQALVDRSKALAAGLGARGLKKGDRVLFQLNNSPAFVVALYALLRIGVVPVLALPALRIHELQRIAELAKPRAYIVAACAEGYDFHELAQQLESRLPGLDVLMAGESSRHATLTAVEREGAHARAPADVARAGDVALLMMSGGTTGAPKLVCRTHDDYLYMVRASAEVAGLHRESVYLASLPLAHNLTLGSPGIIGALSVGATVIIARTPRADEVLELIEKERVTITAGVPSIASLWVDAAEHGRWDLSSLRVFLIGGAKLTEKLYARLRRAFRCQVQISYGMTEGFLAYTRLDASEESILRTQGAPLSEADELRVVDEVGADVAPGAVGELVVRGPYTHRGYYLNPQLNAEAFTSDGMFRTGDLVKRLASGEIVVHGRSKDVIKRAGENVMAAELEELLRTFPQVGDVAVVGVEDEYLGEQICAAIVSNGESPSRLQLVQFLTSLGVAAFKHPDKVIRVESLPRTPVGKVDKKSLRAALTQRRG